MRTAHHAIVLSTCLFAGCGDARGGDDGLFGEGGEGLDGGSGGSGDGTSAGATGSGADGSSGGADEGAKFDTPDGNTGADDGGNGDCGCGNSDWSYVFIANSQEGTVSKINTRTLVEEGRYLTRSDAGGSPSRTSVSVDGKAVVVANRHVGLVKIWAQPDLCSDTNGTPGIQTSTGKNDVLAWGEDDCVAWFTDFPDMTVQRPVQWTSGVGDCHADQKVWTTTGQAGESPGTCGPGGVWVHRLDGETGMVEDTIHLDDATFACTVHPIGVGLGPYGGAVDFEGNFWFHGFDNGKLARVDFDSLDVEVFSGGGYGITVDTEGRVWTNGPGRFDYASGQWDYAMGASGGSGGIAQDLQGRIWFANGTKGITWVDMETLALGDTVPLPAGPGWTVKGVSADVDGYIWAVRQDETKAFKVHPETYAVEEYDGLNGPYTYSDMTGGQLNNVTCNPPEG